MGVGGEFGKGIDDGGGYDLSALKEAREVMGEKTGDEKGFEDVEPMFIQVLDGVTPVRTEEFEARSVIIEYDEYDNIVSVELL